MFLMKDVIKGDLFIRRQKLLSGKRLRGFICGQRDVNYKMLNCNIERRNFNELLQDGKARSGSENEYIDIRQLGRLFDCLRDKANISALIC